MFISLLLYLLKDDAFIEAVESNSSTSSCAYSRCSLMDAKIPTIVVCGYHEGLRRTLDKAKIKYELKDKLTREEKINFNYDYIKFNDGYIYYELTYESSLLMNGLKDCPTTVFSLSSIDDRKMYLEFLDGFGGRIKADGLENFYDLMIDPITKFPIFLFLLFDSNVKFPILKTLSTISSSENISFHSSDGFSGKMCSNVKLLSSIFKSIFSLLTFVFIFIRMYFAIL